MAVDCNGVILGIVSEDGEIKANNPVVLMDHTDLAIIARTTTDANGGYIFNNLDPDKKDYMLFTVDNNGDPTKTALIKDYVQPITGNTGILNGNFWGMVDALAPDQAVAAFSSAGTNDGVSWTNPVLHRLGGGPGVDGLANAEYGALSNWRTDLQPVPTSTSIIGADTINNICLWAWTPFAWAVHTDINKTVPLTSAQTPATFVVFNKMNGNAVTYSHCATGYSDFNTETNARYATDTRIYNTGNNYPARRTYFNLCFETNGELRIKWYGTNSSANNVLVKSGLPNTVGGDFYMVVVRYGEVGSAFVVDITNCTTGVTERITPETLRTTGFNVGYNLPDPSRRTGLLVSGALNIAGTIETTAWSNAVKAEYGPILLWHKQLTDKNVDDLIKSAVDTVTPWRSQPRFLSEIMALGPTVYIPNDELTGHYNQRISTKGFKKPSRPVRHSKLTVTDKLSGRRRNVCYTGGGGQSIWGMMVPVYRRWTHSYVWTRVSSADALIFDASHLAITTVNSTSYYHALHITAGTAGKVRVYFVRDSGVGQDIWFNAARAIAVGETAMITVVADIYTNLKIRLYINGELAEAQTTAQISGSALGTAAVAETFAAKCRMGVQAPGYPLSTGYDEVYSDGSTVDDLWLKNIISDFCFWPRMLNDAEIKQLYDAWVIATGPDSHA